jgi:hypothetical protein
MLIFFVLGFFVGKGVLLGIWFALFKLWLGIEEKMERGEKHRLKVIR